MDIRNAIILHGLTGEKDYVDPCVPSGSNDHWLPWLQKQLMIAGIKADTPEVPRPYEVIWENWLREAERFEIGSTTSLVGHSLGGGFWMRYLSERTELTVDTVVLVAPWLDPDHVFTTGFFDFDIDPGLTQRVKRFVIFESDDDGQEVKDSIALLREKLPLAEVRTFHNYGHFCRHDMKTEEFPELRDVLLEKN